MMIRFSRWIAAPLLLLVLPSIAAAQAPRVAVQPLECLPTEKHAVVTAQVANSPGGSSVRLYFRRLHQEVEDFYYVEMVARPGGQYWAALPKPADEELDEKRLAHPETEEERDHRWAAWWFAKERSDHRDPNDDLNERIIEERAARGKQVGRDWMLVLTLEKLEEMLEDLENEPAELYAAIVGPDGRELARSPMVSTLVRDDCQVSLTAEERGRANNLVVGETAPWQIGKRVFHWLCDGIVSRIDHLGVLRADDLCRSCVIALVRPELLVPSTASVIGITIIEPVSRVEP